MSAASRCMSSASMRPDRTPSCSGSTVRCAPCARAPLTGDSRSRRTACGIPGGVDLRSELAMQLQPAPAGWRTRSSSSFSASTSHGTARGSADSREGVQHDVFGLSLAPRCRASPTAASLLISRCCATLRRDGSSSSGLRVRDQFEGHNPRRGVGEADSGRARDGQQRPAGIAARKASTSSAEASVA